MLAIRLPDEIDQRLSTLANKTGRTKTYCAKEAILKYLEEMEETYIAIERLETPEKRWTLGELEQERDLEC
ncbi:anti-toxin [Deltaproteobacteria bacterium TL4]